MSPPKGTPNPLAGPADYDMTEIVHNDTYHAINPLLASCHGGKAVLITGASRGLGLAIAKSFAAAGASKIAICARSSLSDSIRVLKAIAVASARPEPSILTIELDVTDADMVVQAAEEVKGVFGRLDIVINNAGIVNRGMLVESNATEWHQVWQVNVFGVYHVMRAFIPLLLQTSDGDKTIINISSVGAHLTTKTFSAYETSKLATVRLTEFACAEYGEQGILAYCIHPGNVPTDINGGSVENMEPHLRPVFVDTPEMCADSLAYLTREKRDWLAGRYINVSWDLPELITKRADIVEKDLLKIRLAV